MQQPQHGGTQYMPVLDEIKVMSGHFLLLFLVLVCVYVSRIPNSVLQKFHKRWVQGICFLAVIVITVQYGYVHGILAALAFSLVLSHALRFTEGLVDYFPTFYSTDLSTNTIIPKNHRWFGEKILGENPFIIREKEVTTSSVQDLSERTMGTGASNVSR
jgi:hypothetical protein